MIFGALPCRLFDPPSHRPVLVRPSPSRDAAVGNVPGQRVPEGILGLSLHRRVPDRTNPLPRNEAAQ